MNVKCKIKKCKTEMQELALREKQLCIYQFVIST